MEIIIVYMIVAMSFSIMYTIQYTRDIVWSVLKVCAIFDIETKDKFIPTIFYIASFIAVTLLAPMYLYELLTVDRKSILKNKTKDVMLEFFNIKD